MRCLRAASSLISHDLHASATDKTFARCIVTTSPDPISISLNDSPPPPNSDAIILDNEEIGFLQVIANLIVVDWLAY